MSKTELKLGVLVIEDCMLSSIASATDTLRVASELARIREPASHVRLDTLLFSANGLQRVRTSAGVDLAGLAAPAADFDMVLVPGLMHDSARMLVRRVADLRDEVALLCALHAAGTPLAGVCSGTFLLAEAGVLDGRRATTSWWLGAAMRQRYPGIRVEADAMLVEDGGVLTAGGATAVLDLMLRVVARAGGEELAQQTGRLMVVDAERQSQAPYVSQALLDRPRDSMTERIDHFLQRELHREISVTRLASHCGTSERSLLRHFRACFGATPIAYIQQMRVERAKALLESTHLSLEEIVERCGYSDLSSFRRLFRRTTTLTPGDYRERFRLRRH
ncbi:MAG TPA: helix-turn-helix domain-containing protein [Xanthomonadaceae bacterium]|nr:helix-turn-helix domain-containing protein [Xanthomonadaceae bacterium]